MSLIDQADRLLMGSAESLAKEIRQYMASYACSYEKAKLDVLDEYNQTPSDVDAFYDRMEAQS